MKRPESIRPAKRSISQMIIDEKKKDKADLLKKLKKSRKKKNEHNISGT